MGLQFRPNTVDFDCWRGIVDGNEYDLPSEFEPRALIIDIGTHVGSFVQACWNRGARRIVSYEADPENFSIAHNNVSHLPGVTLVNGAVSRSDEHYAEHVYFSGYERFFDGRINTGAGNVFASDGLKVPAVRFDSIFPNTEVELLKLDCEGAEWPILYTSKNLSKVKRIVGEYHSLPRRIEGALGLPYPCITEALERFLMAQGFAKVTVQPFNETHAAFNNGQKIGLFSASR